MEETLLEADSHLISGTRRHLYLPPPKKKKKLTSVKAMKFISEAQRYYNNV